MGGCRLWSRAGNIGSRNGLARDLPSDRGRMCVVASELHRAAIGGTLPTMHVIEALEARQPFYCCGPDERGGREQETDKRRHCRWSLAQDVCVLGPDGVVPYLYRIVVPVRSSSPVQCAGPVVGGFGRTTR